MTMELKWQEQANPYNHTPISDADLIKMYDYLSNSDSAQVLQRKVNFKNGHRTDHKHLLILYFDI